jgi:hypothetical protein
LQVSRIVTIGNGRLQAFFQMMNVGDAVDLCAHKRAQHFHGVGVAALHKRDSRVEGGRDAHAV